MTAVLDIALDDVTDDAIGLVSHGHKYTFALIALYKRLLQMPIKDGERFRLLQELNSMTGHEISPAGLALVDPASDPELAIIDQANQADVGNDKRSIASFDILSSSRVFRVLLKLNSGMRAAVMIGHNIRGTLLLTMCRRRQRVLPIDRWTNPSSGRSRWSRRPATVGCSRLGRIP
jgi:hypothetical protein